MQKKPEAERNAESGNFWPRSTPTKEVVSKKGARLSGASGYWSDLMREPRRELDNMPSLTAIPAGTRLAYPCWRGENNISGISHD
jgi:hypothetical protein